MSQTRPARPRFDLEAVAPGAESAIGALDTYVAKLSLEPALLELVRVRASQLNGCTYCLDIHTKDARARGESEQRLYALPAWRESPFFTDRERAALAWAEAITLVSADRVPDAVYAEVRAQLSEAELAGILLATLAINAWNRVAISQRLQPGGYVSPFAPRPARPAATAAAAALEEAGS
ncbi:MAG TPA: carboxymuconolactone decarboxylase family protein [Gemmatimonadales bacterium]|nr:carboxymuconolactone decarboxylase family protein [Gemmatimonadales bacterium]